MSHRARSARHLSTVLTNESHVYVVVRYYRQLRGYAVCWKGGPTKAEMYRLVAKHADKIPEIPVAELVWLRTEPTPSPYGRRP